MLPTVSPVGSFAVLPAFDVVPDDVALSRTVIHSALTEPATGVWVNVRVTSPATSGVRPVSVSSTTSAHW